MLETLMSVCPDRPNYCQRVDPEQSIKFFCVCDSAFQAEPSLAGKTFRKTLWFRPQPDDQCRGSTVNTSLLLRSGIHLTAGSGRVANLEHAKSGDGFTAQGVWRSASLDHREGEGGFT